VQRLCKQPIGIGATQLLPLIMDNNTQIALLFEGVFAGRVVQGPSSVLVPTNFVKDHTIRVLFCPIPGTDIRYQEYQVSYSLKLKLQHVV